MATTLDILWSKYYVDLVFILVSWIPISYDIYFIICYPCLQVFSKCEVAYSISYGPPD